MYSNVIQQWCGFNYNLISKSYQDTWRTMHGMHTLTDAKIDTSFLLKIAKDSDWLSQIE